MLAADVAGVTHVTAPATAVSAAVSGGAVAASGDPARRLRALAHPVRLALNRALQLRGEAPATAPELAAAVGVPAADARRHLRVLVDAGLLARHGSGRSTCYTSLPSATRELAQSIHSQLLPPGGLTSGPAGDPGSVEARLRLLSRVAEQVADGVSLVDSDGWLIYANPAFGVMHGYGDTNLTGRHFSAFYPVDGQDAAVARMIADARAHGVGRAELWRRRSDGSLFPAAVTLSLLRNDQGELLGRVLSVQDITARRQGEDRLREQALEDPLTGLANRRSLLQRLKHALSGATPGAPVAVLFCDLDGFKQVNDWHGHDTGDQLLREVGRRLLDCLRPEDTLARLGGDEFVALLPGVDLDTAHAVADRFRGAVRGPVPAGAQILTVGLSVGVAMGRSGSPERLLATADAAMYRDKPSRGLRARLPA